MAFYKRWTGHMTPDCHWLCRVSTEVEHLCIDCPKRTISLERFHGQFSVTFERYFEIHDHFFSAIFRFCTILGAIEILALQCMHLATAAHSNRAFCLDCVWQAALTFLTMTSKPGVTPSNCDTEVVQMFPLDKSNWLNMQDCITGTFFLIYMYKQELIPNVCHPGTIFPQLR